VVVSLGTATIMVFAFSPKKLDRGIANVEWRLSFPEAFVEVLCRLHSDHNPILLHFGGLPLARGPRPFVLKQPGLTIKTMPIW
jgi:hypothetical protein